MWRIAHLSDLHLGSWLSHERVDKIVGACRSYGAEHLILTGDITDTGIGHRERDALAVREILMGHGYSDPLTGTVIPGNHDLHGSWSSLATRDRGQRNLRVFFRCFGRFLRNRSRAPRFPIVKRIGRFTLFILNSIVRPGWFGLRYRFPRSQLRSLTAAFRHAGPTPKIVIIHHYPYRIRIRNVPQFGVSEWLEDGLWLSLRGWRRLIRACIDHGVRWILHGHSHTSHMVGFDGADLIALGQGCTGATGEFSIYEIDPLGPGSRQRCRVNHVGEMVTGPPEPMTPELVVPDWYE